ncbi:MAG TPA: hydrogen peroxide-dependent heme synthase [Acidobacteriota bacterium]|nr:hydrogen peroxide-dependent heme synthase [Acidobacteriota bacterium]
MHNPNVPETVEGWSVLHHMFRVRWAGLRSLSAGARAELAAEAASALSPDGPDSGYTTAVHLLGHKADLMVIYFRRTFEDLSKAQLNLQQTRLQDSLEMTTSYVSIVELGMYEMTAKIHQQLAEKGLKPATAEFEKAFDEELAQQKKRMMGRLFPEIPRRRHVCFYPMDKRRGEHQNWYTTEFIRRNEMMLEHGIVGRNYSGQVTQIISGSIGFDDWEWGVDLFADDALVFKKLIYEMRFDEASAVYAEFGPFYTGLQFSLSNLDTFLEGNTPAL